MSRDLAAGGCEQMVEHGRHSSGALTRPVEYPAQPGTPLSVVVLLQRRVQQQVVCECGCFILRGTLVWSFLL